MIVDLSEVKPLNFLDVGRHEVYVYEHNYSSNINGKPYIEYTFRDEKGATHKQTYYTTEAALYRLQPLISACGFDPRGRINTEDLVGRKVVIYLEAKTYTKPDGGQGKFHEISKVEPLQGQFQQQTQPQGNNYQQPPAQGRGTSRPGYNQNGPPPQNQQGYRDQWNQGQQPPANQQGQGTHTGNLNLEQPNIPNYDPF